MFQNIICFILHPFHIFPGATVSEFYPYSLFSLLMAYHSLLLYSPSSASLLTYSIVFLFDLLSIFSPFLLCNWHSAARHDKTPSPLIGIAVARAVGQTAIITWISDQRKLCQQYAFKCRPFYILLKKMFKQLSLNLEAENSREMSSIVMTLIRERERWNVVVCFNFPYH